MNSSGRLLHSTEHLASRYLLLLCILAGVFLAILCPGPGHILDKAGVNTWLIACIFLVEGLGMDTSKMTNPRSFVPVILAGALVALILYPMAAALAASLLDLSPDSTVGLILMSSMPTTLAAAVPMTLSAGGDPATAIILVVSLNIFGLATIPLDLGLWLGSHTTIAPGSILSTLVVCLFLPMGLGQAIRRLRPATGEALHQKVRNAPKILIGLLIYISSVKESALFGQMSFLEFGRLIIPCLAVHISMLVVAWITARKVLKLPRDKTRAFALICSEKPVTLSLALWSLHFSHTHPLAVFPPIIFYTLQMITDSLAAARVSKIPQD